MISSDDKVILIFIAIVFGIGWVGFQLGVQTTEQRIDNELRTCLEEKEKLQEENQNIKQDVAELLIEYYGKPLVWDILGVTKYTKTLCALKILLKEDITLINEFPC